MCFRPATAITKRKKICLDCGSANPDTQTTCSNCSAELNSEQIFNYVELPPHLNAKEEKKVGFETDFNFSSIIGESSRIEQAKKLAKRFAASSANVLLIGESGTGKELFAQAIHNQSCPSGPYMVLNCAAIPRNLIESELFGYDGGAFTGAKKSGSPGKIELAQGGTLFLDEIGDMPLDTQAVLLRVLENKQVMRVGGAKYQKVDFRLIAATNKDLQLMVDEGAFRLDLYYRLSVLSVHIPPLRQRGEDIIALAKFFLKKHCSNIDKIPEISFEAQIVLKAYDWPGNVRQLENAMIHALHVFDSDTILPEHLPEGIANGHIDQNTKAGRTLLKHDRKQTTESIKELEEIAIENALVRTGNNIAQAASILGVSKSTLYRKIKMLGMKE
ncbi:sigma-54 interaction domain-containing protein [Desulfitobacterium hafniense]|uniref:Sigma-54 factor interaction domain-containing protein n=1 Tax=Desulfitobacterium hafniense (strain Y51) TaxID=138119 RepID=Q24N41_DESHY|nr:sigma 54-interacting transcriptional regulator [Desulfitobacterium hafniense]BAE86551.1 hypothetical protein DSY4762 [Desulfitobacterium hafniense Y51]